ncbi:MAG: dienelactone hydrolase [Hyphomicrobiaceae bacterium]|jgi:dienelactone hydrolase
MVRVAFSMLLLITSIGVAQGQEELTLKASDGLSISADVYRVSKAADAPWIVLAHQAGSSRGEYREIAPRLNQLGFNAVAVDQRSGKAFGGVRNGTAQRAATRGLRRSYSSAVPDIEAAMVWARKQTSGRVVLWGSSYSAALAIWMAGNKPELADGVVAMSPGEYIRGRSISKAAAKIKVPVLITSPASERRKWRGIFKAIHGDRKIGFAPSSGGRHGSSALIASRNKSADAYWKVVETFLAKYVAKR